MFPHRETVARQASQTPQSSRSVVFLDVPRPGFVDNIPTGYPAKKDAQLLLGSWAGLL